MALDERIVITRDLRAQLNTQGITGVKFVNLDLFDPATNPALPLPFPVPEDTIPAATSLMGGIEQGLMRAFERLPAVLDATLATLGQIRQAVEVMREHVSTTTSAIAEQRSVTQEMSSSMHGAAGAVSEISGNITAISAAVSQVNAAVSTTREAAAVLAR